MDNADIRNSKRKSVLAWHFVGDKLRDGRPVPDDGVTLVHNEPLEMCVRGLHASKRLLDALQYAPGNTICRVLCSGEIIHNTDKLVSRNRVIRWRVDGERVLRDFARQQALSVEHLWDIPAVVRQYLETGEESIRSAAWAAAGDAAGDAANKTLTKMVIAEHKKQIQ